MKNRKLTDTMEDAASSTMDNARDTFASMNNSLMKAMDQNRMIAQNLMRAVQEESLRFMNQRLEHTSRAFERSRECEGFSQFLNLQHDWLMEFARDYAEFNKRFSDVWHEATEQSVERASDMVADASRASQKMESESNRVAAE
jgi:4-alpha-glucanotransferase